MLATILVIISIAMGCGWIVAELKSRTMARILTGCLTIVCVSSSVLALKDLEYRLLFFWVSLAFEEVSAQIKAGNEAAVHQAIARYLDKVRHDPSNRAAAELIHELNPQYGAGAQKR